MKFRNPLKHDFDAAFFKSIPRSPGVYFMYNERGELLYVGKSKCLRARLLSYRRARVSDSPRKLIRLLKKVKRLEWEVLETEVQALLRENFLLRTHRPPFNVSNTRPDLYYFIGVEWIGSQARFSLTVRPEAKTAGAFFGAFKSRGLTRHSYAALLRLIWASQASTGQGKLLLFPTNLTRDKPPYEYHVTLAGGDFARHERWRTEIEEFLTGRSVALLHNAILQLLENPRIHPLHFSQIQEDLDLLQEFFRIGPERNRKLLEFQNEPGPQVPQHVLDDWLVLHAGKLHGDEAL